MKPLHLQYEDDFADILQPALDQCGGSHSMWDISDAIENGHMQFWPGVKSAMVTQIEQTPRRKFVHFFLAAGNLPELEAMLPTILAWAKSQGCDGATLAGRVGWQRSFLAAQGWTPQAVVMGYDFPTPESAT